MSQNVKKPIQDRLRGLREDIYGSDDGFPTEWEVDEICYLLSEAVSHIDELEGKK